MVDAVEPVQRVALRRPSLAERFVEWIRSPGLRSSLPVLALFAGGFVGPLVIVAAFSFIPERTFGFHGEWTVDNYLRIITENYYISFLWSFGFAGATVAILLVACYPLAYALAKVFGRWATVFTLLMVMPLFVSENVRLFGWLMFLLKGSGILAGTVKTLFNLETGTLLYEYGTILFGLCYVYLPFTLFPMVLGLSMVPKDLVDAARDLGANRLQIFREIELPIAMSGFLIGGLLTFILAVGAVSEAKVLGGQKAIVLAHDIQHEFTFAQNWPLGSALSMLVVLLTGLLVFAVMRRLDLDKLIGRR